MQMDRILASENQFDVYLKYSEVRFEIHAGLKRMSQISFQLWLVSTWICAGNRMGAMNVPLEHNINYTLSYIASWMYTFQFENAPNDRYICYQIKSDVINRVPKVVLKDSIIYVIIWELFANFLGSDLQRIWCYRLI